MVSTGTVMYQILATCETGRRNETPNIPPPFNLPVHVSSSLSSTLPTLSATSHAAQLDRVRHRETLPYLHHLFSYLSSTSTASSV